MKTVIEMAREAGTRTDRDPYEFTDYNYLSRFAEIVRADEREACAKVCEGYCGPDYDTVSDILAAQIRARGNT